MNNKTKAMTVAGTIALTLGMGVVSAPAAQAAQISCGQPAYDPALEGVVHSCDGTGLIKYTIDCTWPPDVTFTHRWEYGSSQVLPYTCNGRGEWSVSYEIIE